MQHIRRQTRFCLICLLGMMLSVFTALHVSSYQSLKAFDQVTANVMVEQGGDVDTFAKSPVTYDVSDLENVILPEAMTLSLLSGPDAELHGPICPDFSHCGALTPRPPSA